MRFLAVVLLVAGCHSQTSSAPADLAATGTCTYGESELRGHVGAPITELSGLVASRAQPGVLWAHNDSGNPAELFALDTHGAVLSTIRVVDGAGKDVKAEDWEDITLGGTQNAPMIFIADSGDNEARETQGAQGRKSIAVYGLAEPDAHAQTVLAERHEFTYPDAPHDCEAVTLDPLDGALYFITKQGAPAPIYRARPPFIASQVLEKVGTIDYTIATAADVSTDGKRIAVRGYLDVQLFERRAGQSFVDALQAPFATRSSEVAAESVAFDSDAHGYYTAPEGAGAELWLTPCL